MIMKVSEDCYLLDEDENEEAEDIEVRDFYKLKVYYLKQ